MAWRATHGAQVPEGIEYPPFPATYTDQHLESAQYLNELEEEMDELLWAHSFSKIEKGGGILFVCLIIHTKLCL